MPESSSEMDAERVLEIKYLKRRIDIWLWGIIGSGLVITSIFGLMSGVASGPNVWVLANLIGMVLALALAGAALGIGVLAGFLFGLPRSLTSSEFREIAGLRSSSVEAGGDGAGNSSVQSTPAAARGSFTVNTNLERISDWLTTIIVGVGLTQLYGLVPAIEHFGDRVEPVFRYGGRVFGIGAGLFFLIFGFLMSYISTRTKLTLVFTENERDAKAIGEGLLERAAVTRAASMSPIAAPTGSPPRDGDQPGGSTPQVAATADDAIVLQRSLSNAQTPEQTLAIANASARSGDYRKALVLYGDYVKSNPFDARIWTDYASVLGLNGDLAAMDALAGQFTQNGFGAQLADAEAAFQRGMRTALQANLFIGGYDESVRVGEALAMRNKGKGDAWEHVWLACAYGQRHASLKGQSTREAEAEAARSRVVEEAKKAVALDPNMKSMIASLYDPAKQHGDDNDLQSLYRDEALDVLIANS